MNNEPRERAIQRDRPSSLSLARAILVVGLLTLVALTHTAILYFVVVGSLPAVVIAATPLVLVVFGIGALFRQSWRGGRAIAGQLAAAATTVLALAFVTGTYRVPAPESTDPAARFVVDAISVPDVPTFAGLTVGFELAGVRASVAQFLLPVVVGYVVLAGALWAHPAVAALGARLAGE